MSCRRVDFAGGSAYICGPSIYEIRLRGRTYTVEAGSYGGPAFLTAGDEPWKRQPYNGELWNIGERMIWAHDAPGWKDGEERTDEATGARVTRVW